MSMPDGLHITADLAQLIPNEVNMVRLAGEPEPVAVLTMRGIIMMSLLGQSELGQGFRSWALQTLEGILTNGSYLPTTTLPPEAARLAKLLQDARAAGVDRLDL